MEVENLLKIKKPKKKHKILVYPKPKNNFFKESDNGFEVKDLELRKEKGEFNENL